MYSNGLNFSFPYKVTKFSGYHNNLTGQRLLALQLSCSVNWVSWCLNFDIQNRTGADSLAIRISYSNPSLEYRIVIDHMIGVSPIH